MKKLLPALFILSVLLNGCFSLPELGDMSLTDKVGKSVSESMGLGKVELEMQALQFYALYMGYAFYGGYSSETEFEEGQGLHWAHTSNPSDGDVQKSEFQKAFLKDMKDDTFWWRLSVMSEEETVEYEYLQDGESNILKLRFRDPDTGEVVEYIPSDDEESSESDEQVSDGDEVVVEEVEDSDDLSDYKQYSVGTEKITVPAGTYTADHMVSEITDNSDPENPTDLRTDWWVVESVPGNVIKYEWNDRTDGSSMTSILMAVLENQTTGMDSY